METARERILDVSVPGAFSPVSAPGSFTPGSFVAPGVAEQYMNPFIENVIDVQQRRARRQFEEDVVPQLGAQAVGQGAFGGSRAALSEAANPVVFLKNTPEGFKSCFDIARL